MIIATSTKVVAPNGTPNPAAVAALTRTRAAGPVAVISNNDEPAWFSSSFPSATRVQFVKQRGRQNGRIISENATRLKHEPWDTIVLAGVREDIQMGKNGGAVLIGAGWSPDFDASQYGINADSPADFEEIVRLSGGWPGGYWYTADCGSYQVRAISDLSSLRVGLTQQGFARRVTSVAKNGGPRLMALLTVTVRSLLSGGVPGGDRTMWGVYPSSSSSNDDTEALSDFTHRLRTTASRDRMAKRGVPLFIRHRPSAKRSSGGSRAPSEQIESVHLNPAYRRSVSGRRVVVVDDCATYGLSLGVAAAFLRRAGAAEVTGVALGKFGNCLQAVDVDLRSDPFRPVASGSYDASTSFPTSPASDSTAQGILRTLL